MNKSYGQELILDLHNCDPEKFNRMWIEMFFEEVCATTKMQKCELCWFDDQDTPEGEKQTDPQTTGTSAVQFILTSNITIHTLDLLKNVYLNFFSCKEYDPEDVVKIALEFFGGAVVSMHFLERK